MDKRRRLRRIQLQRKRRRKNLFVLSVLITLFLFFGIYKAISSPKDKIPKTDKNQNIIENNLEKKEVEKVEKKGIELDLITDNTVAVYDLNKDVLLYENNLEKQVLPASLSKLFVVDYALTLLNPNDTVNITDEINLVKPDSSMAHIEQGSMQVSELVRGVLIPSGNDAAYALAAAGGRVLNNDIEISGEEAVSVFMKGLNDYLKSEGYKDTIIDIPSGYSDNSLTTFADLLKVSKKILRNGLISEIVSQSEHYHTTESGNELHWINTNEFLLPYSDYYNENVKGIKTGSLDTVYNLITRYKKDKGDYLIFVLGAASSSERFNETNTIMQSLDKND